MAEPAGEPSVVSLGPTPTPPPRRRYAIVGAATLAVMLVAGAAALPMLRHEPGGPAAPADPELGAVRVYGGLSRDHTTGDVDYPVSPPVGGPHDPAWLECGAYDEPVRDENAVHDLEHGTVWIAYEPGLAAADVAALESALPQNGIMAPYPGLRAAVVVTVWGRQLLLADADDPRLVRFVTEFGHGETAPEPNASCAGGLDDPRGGHEPAGTSV